MQSDGPFRMLKTSHMAASFIPTLECLLGEDFCHAAIIAQRLFNHKFIPLSIGLAIIGRFLYL